MSRTVGTPILDSNASSATFGVAHFSSGVAVVNTTSVKTSSVIIVSPLGGGTLANLGIPFVPQSLIANNISFTIYSFNIDLGLPNVIDDNYVSWLVLEPTTSP